MNYRVMDESELSPPRRRGRRGMYHDLPWGEIGGSLRDGKPVAVPRIPDKSEPGMRVALKRDARKELGLEVSVWAQNGELVMRAVSDSEPTVKVGKPGAAAAPAERHDPAVPPQPAPKRLGPPRPEPVYSTAWGHASHKRMRFLSDTEAAEDLVDLIERARLDKPFDIERFIDFLEAFWRFCHEHNDRLGQLYIAKSTWDGFPAAIDGEGSPAYLDYRKWLTGQGVVKLLVPGQKGEPGKKGVASLYSVAIPMCDGNPWPRARTMLAGHGDGPSAADFDED